MLNKETKYTAVCREIETLLCSEVLLALLNEGELFMSLVEQS
jgi:hypothetical protein